MYSKHDELDKEMDFQIHLHEPRRTRIETDIHNVRAGKITVNIPFTISYKDDRRICKFHIKKTSQRSPFRAKMWNLHILCTQSIS